MKAFVLSSIICLAATNVTQANPNNTLIKANYLYDHLAYHEAISYYEQLAVSNNDPVLLAKLGDCYRLTKKPEQAIVWYERANALNGCPEDARLHYAQTLMTLGKYQQAIPYLEKYQAVMTADNRTANLLKSCRTAEQMTKAMPSSTIYFQQFNSDYSEFGPALRKNDLFFTADTATNGGARRSTWTGTPYYTIYSTGCNESGVCNTAIKPLKGDINSKYHDGPCSFSPDGKTMYFTRTNYIEKFLSRSAVPGSNGVVRLQILMATNFDANEGKYKTIKPLNINSDNYSTAHPSISADGNTMVFASDMPGGVGGSDLYMIRKQGDGKWGKPENLGKAVNTEGDEMFPFMAADNKLYFASDGQVGFGGLDIYSAGWSEAQDAYVQPMNMGMPVNSSYDDMSLTLNETGEAGFFASDRPAEKKGDNIYGFVNKRIFLGVRVVDEYSGSIIPGATVNLNGADDKRLFTSNDKGIVFTQLYPEAFYKVQATKTGYNASESEVSTKNLKGSDTLRTTITLKPEFNVMYSTVVLDEQTGEPIADPQLVFVNNTKFRSDTVNLNTGQVYAMALEENTSYSIYAIKENYYGNEKYLSTKDIKPGAGSLVKDTMYMKKLQVGEVYKIDNIYYDYNKANIREDAKPSLDRLLSLLNQYPAMQIQVNSHTDCRGADAYNAKLSNARAQSVIKYLQQRGIPVNRLKYKGYGESMPVEQCSVCDKCTEQQHQANRRTEFQIIAM